MGKSELTYTKRTMSQDEFFYAYKQLIEHEEEYIFLESGRGGELCIAGLKPSATLQASDDEALQINWWDGRTEKITGDPLSSLEKFIQQYEHEQLDELPHFQGGVLGFISYDYVRQYEKLRVIAQDDLKTPDIFFYLFDNWAVYDIASKTAYFMALPNARETVEDMAKEWEAASAKGLAGRKIEAQDFERSYHQNAVNVSITEKQFEEKLWKIQQYIRDEEVVQVNLTVRQDAEMTIDAVAMYEVLRIVNPSPYMALIGAKAFSVVSSSPELLVKKRGLEMSTRPIGGTRKRGASKEADLALEQELLANKKENAEHLMLVELEKKDFAKVCEEATIEVNELLVVERYSHVMHLVSNVRGKAMEHVTNADIIRAVFPGGTITGDPKVRTMEIIEELEPERRGLYTGSIGWLGFDGDLELNVVIRTAFIQDERIYIQAGAGLVAESDAAAEYVESLAKAQALWQTKAMAERL